jgi:hypothetical protein
MTCHMHAFGVSKPSHAKRRNVGPSVPVRDLSWRQPKDGGTAVSNTPRSPRPRPATARVKGAARPSRSAS